MPRKQRVDFPGAWHHVMNRGRRREAVFVDDDGCQLFLDVIGAAVEHNGCEVHGYSLMPNHFHLLVRSARGDLSAFMREVVGVYSQRLNRLHGWDGAVFRGRFKSQLVTDEAYLGHLLAYLHLNPVRAHLVSRPDEPSWTSHRPYLGLDRPPPWLSTETLLGLLGGREGVEAFVRELHCGTRPWPDALDTARGWLVERDTPPLPPRDDPETTPMNQAAEVEAAVCALTGATPDELRRAVRGPRANPARRFAVWALRQSTSMSQSEIGRHLGMSANQVAKVLSRMRPGQSVELDAWQAAWTALARPGS